MTYLSSKSKLSKNSGISRREYQEENQTMDSYCKTFHVELYLKTKQKALLFKNLNHICKIKTI